MTASARGVRGSSLLLFMLSRRRLYYVDQSESTNPRNGSYSILTEFGEDIRDVSPAPRRILVVDDDPMVATTIQRVLRPEGYDVDVALGGAAALEQAQTRRPDLVVLDLMMPGIDGLEVCRQLRADGSLPILMLTARSGTADRVRGLDTGADDYLVKPFAYTELLARVRALLRRATPPSTLLQFADLTLEVETREVRRSGRLVQLTAKEFALLTHFLRHPRLVLTREQLLRAVWADEETDDNVVAVYVGYLRTKLDGTGEPRLIQTVRGFGYSLREA
jgi:two-component system, OmpR family, response regulator MprA